MAMIGFYVKKTPVPPAGYTAKSVILDIADNYGYSLYVALRAFDFYFEGSKIINTWNSSPTKFVSYATSEYSNIQGHYYAFSTDDSKIGSEPYTTWFSELFAVTNQRLICVFNNPTQFDEIRIVNAHNSGVDTDKGVKNIKINISMDEITSIVYNEVIPNSTLIYDDTFDEHSVVNEPDEQILTLI